MVRFYGRPRAAEPYVRRAGVPVLDSTGISMPLWVGSRSCAIYLIHAPSVIFTREIWAHLYLLLGQCSRSPAIGSCSSWKSISIRPRPRRREKSGL